MFYKNEFYQDLSDFKYNAKYAGEFAFAIYKKLKKGQVNCNLVSIKDKNNIKGYACIIKNEEDNNNKYIMTNKGIFLLNLFKHCEITELKEEEFKAQYKMNKTQLKKVEDYIKDFYNYKYLGVVCDKYKKEYDLHRVVNSDSSIGDDVIIDKIYLTDKENGKQVGYIKLKYTTPYYLSRLSIGTEKAMENNLFLNVATVDYSYVKPEYNKKGLGYILYYKAAEQLNKEGIEFRGSSIQSEFAKIIWKKLEDHFPKQIYRKSLCNGEFYTFLKMGRSILDFENNTPIIRKSKKNKSIKIS